MIEPVYKSDRVTIYCGDCLTILPQIGHVDAVITDPPYGIGYVHSGKCNGRWHRVNTTPIQGDDHSFDPSILLGFPEVIMWGVDHYANLLPPGRWYVWDKLGGRDSFGDSFGDAEFAWHNRLGASRIFRHLWKGICTDGGTAPKRSHPSQKPVALMAWCIRQAKVEPGQTILDPFMGSGTTGVAALALGCKFIGIECEKKYVDISVRRIIAAESQGRLFEQQERKMEAQNLFETK